MGKKNISITRKICYCSGVILYCNCIWFASCLLFRASTVRISRILFTHVSSWLLVCQTHRREAISPGGMEDFPMKITVICQWRAKIDELGVLVSHYRRHSIVSFSETRLQEHVLDTYATISSFLMVQEDKRKARELQKLVLIKSAKNKHRNDCNPSASFLSALRDYILHLSSCLLSSYTSWSHASRNNYKHTTSKLFLPM